MLTLQTATVPSISPISHRRIEVSGNSRLHNIQNFEIPRPHVELSFYQPVLNVIPYYVYSMLNKRKMVEAYFSYPRL
jgi:hypothetical protein